MICSGLGRETSISAAKKGYELILLGKSEESLRETKELIEKENGKADIYPANLVDEFETRKVF